MKKRLVIGWVFLLLLPLVGFGWLGSHWAEQEQARLDRALDELLLSKLQRWSRAIEQYFSTTHAHLELLAGPLLQAELSFQDIANHEVMGKLERHPMVRAVFLLNEKGGLEFPGPELYPGDADQDFRQRIKPMLKSGLLLAPLAPAEEPSLSKISREGGAPKRSPVRVFSDSRKRVLPKLYPEQRFREGVQLPPSEWIAWFSGRGVGLFLRFPLINKRILGLELNRSRLLADLIQILPEDDIQDLAMQQARIRLEGPSGQILYQWGGFSPQEQARPRVDLQLPNPVGAWRLAYFISPQQATRHSGTGAHLQVIVALISLAIMMCLSAFYLYREQQRSWHEAQERVSFVNKVSHELKTPLTNIRLHAELLAEELADDLPEAIGPARRVGIMVGECQRLSRLIGNVLTFSRGTKNLLKLQARPTVPSIVIAAVMDRFEPVLAAGGIKLESFLKCDEEVVIDPDILEQILGNLVSNAEKYAVRGAWLRVTCDYVRTILKLEVADHGPGIPLDKREKVFEPFFRLSDRLDDGVTGTGIGLAIVRDLAILHGGMAEILNNDADEQGICVRVTLCCREPDSLRRTE